MPLPEADSLDSELEESYRWVQARRKGRWVLAAIEVFLVIAWSSTYSSQDAIFIALTLGYLTGTHYSARLGYDILKAPENIREGVARMYDEAELVRDHGVVRGSVTALAVFIAASVLGG